MVNANKNPKAVKLTAVNIDLEVYKTFRLHEPKENLSKLVTNMLKERHITLSNNNKISEATTKDLDSINEAIDEYNLHLEFLGDLLPILDSYYKGAVGFAMDHVIQQRDELIKTRRAMLY